MRQIKNPKNILVIRTDRIGDVVLTTPAIRVLRKSFPQAKISVLISPVTLDLLKGNSDVDQILIDDRRGVHSGWRGFRHLIKEIRNQKFDVAINFHTKKRTNLLCFLARIPRRIGYCNNKLGFLLTDKFIDVRPQGKKHEAQYCLDLLRVFAVENNDLTMVVQVQDDAERWAESFLDKFRSQNENVKFVALHLESSCPTRCWPTRYFADVIQLMSNREKKVFIVIGTDIQQAAAADLAKLSGGKLVIHNLVGQTSLARTISLLKRCDLLICNDSGPSHIAAAFDTPVVVIFTRNQPGINPERWHPLGEHSHYVCPPVDMELSFEKGEIKDHGFLYRVTPQQVLDIVDAIF